MLPGEVARVADHLSPDIKFVSELVGPEPVDIGDILADVMPPGWHELPIGRRR
ncbi:MAG: hypothetical protein IT381_10370 [Deltaproteobacteria bacterium]|nr:hypothetical protein [Deltaproteobacteria bacterium]